jgi:hypothetical protein
MNRIANSPFESAQSHWVSMLEALDAAEAARRNSDQLAIRLIAENEMLQDQLDSANAERKLWQAYAVAVDTKLEIVASVIETARNDARRQAKDEAQRPEAEKRPDTPAPQIADQRPPQRQETPIQPEPPRQVAKPINSPRDQDFEFRDGLPQTILPQNEWSDGKA